MRTRGMGIYSLAAAALSLGIGAGPAIIDESTMMREPSQPKRRIRKSPALGMGYGGRRYLSNVPANINRWTGKPHEHKREIARRTTAPGTAARRAAMAQASNPA